MTVQKNPRLLIPLAILPLIGGVLFARRTPAPREVGYRLPRPTRTHTLIGTMSPFVAPALALVLANPAIQDDPAAWTETVAPPRDVTEQTRADVDVLAALQAPGEVLFEDDFESGEGSLAKYFEIRGGDDGRVTLASLAHAGEMSLRCVAPDREGRASGSGVSGWLGAQGHDRVYLRRYIRFAKDYDQGNLNHTGGGLTGIAGSGKWDGMGKAGIRPRGDDRFSCRFEPWRDWGQAELPGYLFLYTYWVDMVQGGDGHWWGNMLQPPPKRRIIPPRGEWVCLEQMIQVNDIGQANGELAAWVDGELYLHFTGIRWRTDERVKVKRFNLGIYIHKARRENIVWYDDVVVSTGYVGPLGKGKPSGAAGPIK
jgi:polysaccharide lyase-like protein